jgi:hypothetical protein
MNLAHFSRRGSVRLGFPEDSGSRIPTLQAAFYDFEIIEELSSLVGGVQRPVADRVPYVPENFDSGDDVASRPAEAHGGR